MLYGNARLTGTLRHLTAIWKQGLRIAFYHNYFYKMHHENLITEQVLFEALLLTADDDTQYQSNYSSVLNCRRIILHFLKLFTPFSML